MNVIASEQQAEQVGERITGGKRHEAFAVYQYVERKTGLTLFGIKITATGKAIALV